MSTKIDSIVQEICRHAENDAPFECCGLIDDTGSIHRCENVAKKRGNEFLISSHEFKRSARNRKIIGVYHSHINKRAYVSQADRAGMPFNGLYVVASVLKGVCRDVQMYLHKQGQFTKIKTQAIK